MPSTGASNGEKSRLLLSPDLPVEPPAVLYQDSDLIAVSKSSGQLVVPGRGKVEAETLQEELARRLGTRVWVVHRLDRGASGLVLFAKNAEAHRSLSLQFEGRKVRKTYLALVLGCVQKGGLIRQRLREFGSGRMGVDVKGKPSATRYRVRESFPETTLLEAEPLTGRRHQVRVHLYHIGHPVLGDARYGSPRPVGGVERLMLHSLELFCRDPAGRSLVLRSEPPPDFLEVVESFRECSLPGGEAPG